MKAKYINDNSYLDNVDFELFKKKFYILIVTIGVLPINKMRFSDVKCLA